MTKQTQQMPLLMVVGDISHLTDKEAEQIKKYIELDTILDVQFKDAAGEVMIPTGVIPEVLADDGSVTSNAYVTVIKNGNIVKAEVTEKLPAPVIKGTTPYDDHEYNGYIEAMTRDWQPISDMRLSDKDANYPKSQNTHLHIIEPYTNLYRIWPSKELEHSLRNLISIFTNHILNPETHHLDLFFSMDWTRMSKAESYGHDIECSWLLHEAALVLGDKELMKEVEPIVREVAKASEKGLLPAGAMIHESGDADLHWWVQAEAIVGFFNLYQHFGDEAALEKALSLWDYVKSHLIDWDGGEWYWSIRADGTVNLDDDKAGFWKCPYHNSRMCLEIIEREF